MGPDACASSLIRPFPRVPPFGVRVSGGLLVGRVGGFAWGLWAFPWGGFPLFFALLLLLFVSFVPLFRPSWLSRSFCFFPPVSFSLFLPLFLLVVFRVVVVCLLASAFALPPCLPARASLCFFLF